MMKNCLLPALLATAFAFIAIPAKAEMKNEWVEYRHGDTKLKAYMAYDDRITGKRPAVFVVHAREGMTPKTLQLTEIWAKLGYVSDARYARVIATQKAGRYARRSIAGELKAKGIGSDEIETALAGEQLASSDANAVVGGLKEGLLGNQIKAVLVTIVWSVVATAIIALIVKVVVGLRPTEEVEVAGLDLAEHGEEGYHQARG